MPKWDKYIDEEYEDKFQQIERIRPRPPKGQLQDDDVKRDKNKKRNKHIKNKQ